jgi:hypothetical protein
VVEADALLKACPRCSAWPMTARSAGRWQREIGFGCPRCGEEVTVSLAASLGVGHAESKSTVDG